MRRLLIVFVVLLIVLGGTWRVVAMQPVAPGNPLYGLQRQLTNLRASMTISTASRTDFLLTVLQKRYEDYQQLDGTANERDALLELDAALRKSSISVNELSGSGRDHAFAKLQEIGQKVITTLGDNTGGNLVTGSLEDAVLQQAQAILEAGPSVIIPPQDVQNTQEPTRVPLTVPQDVPFLINSLQNHPFPLDGAHEAVACEGCHTGGAYDLLPSPSKCIDCHEDPHAGDMGLICESCHNTTTWEGVIFDHTGKTDCQSCHTADAPLNHYVGQCTDCHNSTTTWTSYTFDHTGKLDCQSCHTADAPLNHYVGQCTDCHNSTTVWTSYTFDHTGKTDCQSCHTADAPFNHYVGQCSACHTSTEIWTSYIFDHTGQTECLSCHTTDAPPNHYAGQCSTCHLSTDIWTVYSFNHAGLTDCVACHTADAPTNHYAGQCSACHTDTFRWQNYTFDHAGQTDCATCHTADAPTNHYAGQCSACHISTTNWEAYTFNHTGQTDCVVCHQTDKPLNHYAGQCSSCHTSTTIWEAYTFNHTGLTNCSSCHTPPANHYSGECSTCHNTTTWQGATGGHNHIFPTNHGGANNNCVACHTASSSGNWQWSCSSCHSDAAMRSEHTEEGIRDIEGRCLQCHPTGREGEGGDD